MLLFPKGGETLLRENKLAPETLVRRFEECNQNFAALVTSLTHGYFLNKLYGEID